MVTLNYVLWVMIGVHVCLVVERMNREWVYVPDLCYLTWDMFHDKVLIETQKMASLRLYINIICQTTNYFYCGYE